MTKSEINMSTKTELRRFPSPQRPFFQLFGGNQPVETQHAQIGLTKLPRSPIGLTNGTVNKLYSKRSENKSIQNADLGKQQRNKSEVIFGRIDNIKTKFGRKYNLSPLRALLGHRHVLKRSRTYTPSPHSKLANIELRVDSKGRRLYGKYELSNEVIAKGNSYMKLPLIK